MTYNIVLGFCRWDIPAAIILAAVIIVFIVRNHKMKKRCKELNEILEQATGGEDSVANAAEAAVPIK